MAVFPLLAAVKQEGAEQTGVGVLHQFHLRTHTHKKRHVEASTHTSVIIVRAKVSDFFFFFFFQGSLGHQTCTHQEGLVELKGARKLPLQLVDAVQPLQEDGAALVQVLRVFSVAATVAEFVAKVKPIGLHQNLEALHT